MKESPRNAIFYFSDDGDVMAVRVGDYKFNLAEQRANQMNQWAEPFVKLRVPHIVNLRRDPFERADFNSNTYWDWMVDHVPQMYLMQAVVAEQIESFVKFPPRQKPASFNLDAVMAQVTSPTAKPTLHMVMQRYSPRRTHASAGDGPDAPCMSLGQHRSIMNQTNESRSPTCR